MTEKQKISIPHILEFNAKRLEYFLMKQRKSCKKYQKIIEATIFDLRTLSEHIQQSYDERSLTDSSEDTKDSD